MPKIKHKTLYIPVFLLLTVIVVNACRKDTEFISPPPPPPKPKPVPVNTSTLIAYFATLAPNSINSSFWKSVNYHNVTTSNMSTGLYYTVGKYIESDMTGTFSGKSSFNGGADPELVLRAAYDNTNLYILAEWTDNLALSYKSWVWNGPVVVNAAPDSMGWISQHNSDRLAFAFQIDSAYSSSNNAYSFYKSGCATSCHNVPASPGMYPDGGNVDIWEWSKALSAPLGYANDMVASKNGLVHDTGTPTFARNVNGTSDTSGPLYQWNGNTQTIQLPNGTQGVLNPAFYLYEANMTPYTATMQSLKTGDSIYHNTLSGGGQCNSCHGEHGESTLYFQINNDIDLYQNTVSQMEALIPTLSQYSTMQPYWSGLSTTQQNDVLTYVQALIGRIPGNYLQQPTQSAADIQAYDNVSVAAINNTFTSPQSVKFQVLFVRKLNTSNPDDAQFINPTGKSYPFSVALMDNDGKNHIGSQSETITFFENLSL